MPNFTFHGERTQATTKFLACVQTSPSPHTNLSIFLGKGTFVHRLRNFLSLSKLECGPQEINARELGPHWEPINETFIRHFQRIEISATKFEKNANSF